MTALALWQFLGENGAVYESWRLPDPAYHRGWLAPMNQFAILYEDRFTRAAA
jgi:hypothetical protein